MNTAYYGTDSFVAEFMHSAARLFGQQCARRTLTINPNPNPNPIPSPNPHPSPNPTRLTRCLLQFEDFNSNDAFPLLAAHRDTYLTYNDDIQVGSSGWWCWWLSGGGGSTANTPSPTTPSRVPPPWPSLRSSEVTRSRIEPLRLPCTPYPYTP